MHVHRPVNPRLPRRSCLPSACSRSYVSAPGPMGSYGLGCGELAALRALGRGSCRCSHALCAKRCGNVECQMTAISVGTG